MESQPRELEIYKTDDGEEPFSSWLDSLKNRAARAKIKQRLDRVILGNLGNCESVGEGVFELKVDYGPGYRVYFAQIEAKLLLLLCGGDKSTQNRDIMKARQLLANFKQRKNVDD